MNLVPMVLYILQLPSTYPLGVKDEKWKKGVQGGFKNWNIPSDRHTSFQKAFQSVEERICWVRYPAIALHKVDQVFKYYITSL